MGTTMFCYAMMRQRSILGVKPAAPSDIAGLCKISRIQSLTFKPVLADPASWWREEEEGRLATGLLRLSRRRLS